jgi:hypothetical protein
MKVLIAIALGVLVLGTAFGCFLGWSDAREGLIAVIKANTYVRDELGQIFLVYSCKGRDIARYDVDHNILISVSEKEKEVLFEGKETFFDKTYKYGAAFFAGGGAWRLARYAKPAMKYVKLSGAQKWRYFIVGAAAAASGVYSAYNLAAKALPACDDNKIINLIRNAAFWKGITKLIAKDEWAFAIAFFEAGELPEKEAILKDALLQIEEGTINSKFFRTLRDNFETETPRPVADQSRFGLWLTPDMMLMVYIPSIALLIAGFVLAGCFVSGTIQKQRKVRKGSK